MSTWGPIGRLSIDMFEPSRRLVQSAGATDGGRSTTVLRRPGDVLVEMSTHARAVSRSTTSTPGGAGG